MSSTKTVLVITVMFVEIDDQVMDISLGQMEHIMKENLLIICDTEKVCIVITILFYLVIACVNCIACYILCHKNIKVL